MLEGELLGDRYRLERQIGRGGMSQVFEAIDTKFGALVALKVGRPPDGDYADFLARFKREAKIGRRLGRESSRFIRALDWGQHGTDLCWLAMDLVPEATDLDLKSGTREERVARLAEGAALVEVVHALRIVHRDLKPSNFLTGRDGRIHLADFGLAKLLDEEDEHLSRQENMITQTGLAMGTPYYMAPEQIDASNVDHRADVYALGVMLYTALTGELPFTGSIGALIGAQQEVLAGLRPLPRARDLEPDVDPALDEVCARAMALDSSQRLESAAALVQGIGGTCRSDTTTIRKVSQSSVRPPPSTRADRTRGLPRGEMKTLIQDPLTMLGAPGAPTAGRRRRPVPEGLSRIAGPENEFRNERDGSILVKVPSGVFMPASAGAAESAATASLTRVESFYLGKFPVTWGQYRAFCEATSRSAPKQRYLAGDDHPVHGVNWKDAWDYCGWAELRLPTEGEWEFAARGPEERTWPWGESPPTPEHCNWSGHPHQGGKGTTSVHSFPAGASPFGCFDMSGNLLEWTCQRGDPLPGRGEPPNRPTRALRGGAYRLESERCKPGVSLRLSPRVREGHVGFRVACSLTRSTPVKSAPKGAPSSTTNVKRSRSRRSAEASSSGRAALYSSDDSQIVVEREAGRRITKEVKATLETMPGASGVARTQRRELKFVWGDARVTIAFGIPDEEACWGFFEQRVKLDPSRLQGSPSGLANLLYGANHLNAEPRGLRVLVSADRLRFRRYVYINGRDPFTPEELEGHLEALVSDWTLAFEQLKSVQRGDPWQEEVGLPGLGGSKAEAVLILEEILDDEGFELDRLDDNLLGVGFGAEQITLASSGGEVRAQIVIKPWEVSTDQLLAVRSGDYVESVEAVVDELNELNHARGYTLGWSERLGVVASAVFAESWPPSPQRLGKFIKTLQAERAQERLVSVP